MGKPSRTLTFIAFENLGTPIEVYVSITFKVVTPHTCN